MEVAAADEVIEGLTGFEGGVHLDEGVGPEEAVVEVVVDEGPDAWVLDGQEALDVVPVLVNDLCAEIEDVQDVPRRVKDQVRSLSVSVSI